MWFYSTIRNLYILSSCIYITYSLCQTQIKCKNKLFKCHKGDIFQAIQMFYAFDLFLFPIFPLGAFITSPGIENINLIYICFPFVVLGIPLFNHKTIKITKGFCRGNKYCENICSLNVYFYKYYLDYLKRVL